MPFACFSSNGFQHFSKPFGVWSVLVLARNGIFNEPQHHVDLPGKRDAIGRMDPALLKLIKGTHSFRRNAITKVVNNTGGNVILASQLFGNSPDVALKHYFTKADEEKARKALES